ncbi:(2Fe-2S)-binding protein [Photobacterium sp. GJ3]|uniref:2Fe-2S iron-sulfur cluster-binding protein n=1 Tax=Photobacterium sp. GJ3 TaxID=2829502 RepID=UPI001B8C69E7|nr:2Fe-2S iron-sulfur cluster-binding protein [Photobacterium sp. GJ3]QUJ66593.1 (2Fe-2S)-binding protein [Photobacterium sp. GJ3]
MPKVIFQSNAKEIMLCQGDKLLSIDNIDSMAISFGCMKGGCGMCAIRVVEGTQNISRMGEKEISTLEKLGYPISQYRLACQCSIVGDITIA